MMKKSEKKETENTTKYEYGGGVSKSCNGDLLQKKP